MTDLKAGMTEPVFYTRYRVIYGDTDAGGVVYNANYLRFFEIGRTEFMREYAVAYSEIEKKGLILPVTESYLRYKAPARYDDLLAIAVSLAVVTRVSLRFHYRITCMRGEREQLLCKGFTKHACVNRDGTLTSLPETLRVRLAAIIGL